MIQQAREWESSGEYARAVECYLKVTTELTNDKDLLAKCWMKVCVCLFDCAGFNPVSTVIHLYNDS